MRVLIMDIEGIAVGIDLALRAIEAGHEIRYWMPTRAGSPRAYGDGLVEKPDEWEPSMDWADLVVLTGNNKYGGVLAGYFGRGYPIFGANAKGAELELDRGKGQETLKRYGIKTIPYEVVESVEEGIALIKETGKAYAMKPWGGTEDCALTYVSRSPDDGIFTLDKWKREGLFKGQLMMQEKIDGIEIGVAGWFGPGGWSKALEESFEHKKFLNDDLGANTGEMGTVIRHVSHSKLFDAVLEPLTDYLHSINYVGDCSINCMVDGAKVWPMEFTTRLGWPDFNIRQAVIKSDPVEWMLDLVKGKDSLDVSTKIALGVVMAHGDFPQEKDPPEVWGDYPIYGITNENLGQLHYQRVKEGKGFLWVGDKLTRPTMMLTAGTYVMVVSGTGRTVEAAMKEAYGVVDQIKWPSNIMYRTDIGKRLETQLPELQKHGFAESMKYA